MLRTVQLLPQKGFRHWASTRTVSSPSRQSATGPPDSYPDRTHTGKRRRARTPLTFVEELTDFIVGLARPATSTGRAIVRLRPPNTSKRNPNCDASHPLPAAHPERRVAFLLTRPREPTRPEPPSTSSASNRSVGDQSDGNRTPPPHPPCAPTSSDGPLGTRSSLGGGHQPL